MRCARLALCIALLWCSTAFGASELFTIRSKAAIDRIDVRYFLTGAFGGQGNSVSSPDGDGAYRIPLEQDGQPAKDLKAILYAQGCQFAIVSVDLFSDPTRSAIFECRQLPTIVLRGKISPPPPANRPFDVVIRYFAAWDHQFFGLMDGFVQDYLAGRAPLKTGGFFQIRIPDFSKDRVTSQMQDAYFLVLLVEHPNGSMVEVVPSPNMRYRGKIGLRILPSYDPEIEFRFDETR